MYFSFLDALMDNFGERSMKDLLNFIENTIYAKGNDDTDVPNFNEYVAFSTIHCSKGLGASSIFWIADPDVKEVSIADLPLRLRNLYYVAVTRAKENLFVVGGPLPFV